MEVTKLAFYCRMHLDFTDLQLDQAYFYQSLPLCVIDAVYSIGVALQLNRGDHAALSRAFQADSVARGNAFFVANLQNKLKM